MRGSPAPNAGLTATLEIVPPTSTSSRWVRQILAWALAGAVIAAGIALLDEQPITVARVTFGAGAFVALNLLLVALAPAWRWVVRRIGLEETKL